MSEPTQKSPVFIHARVDDAKLRPAEFRVFCGIARRGACYESVPAMARRFAMHAQTVWIAIKRLLDLCMITGERRNGRTTIYRITPMSTWKEPVRKIRLGGKQHPYGNNTHVSKPYGTRTEIKGGDPYGNKGHEVYPKVTGEVKAPRFDRELEAGIKRQKALLKTLKADDERRPIVLAKLHDFEKDLSGVTFTAIEYGLPCEYHHAPVTTRSAPNPDIEYRLQIVRYALEDELKKPIPDSQRVEELKAKIADYEMELAP